MSDLSRPKVSDIQGSCASDFVGVRDAFERNFTLGNEVGAAVAVWVDGDLVVNLWGGSADAARTRPWQQNTLTTVLSGTKGLSATCVHQLADRGELDLQAPVARYWPEFGQAGKEDITLAMVMSHRSGVIGPRTRMSWEQVADWDFVCEQLAAAEPWWEPGTAQGYHMTTFGFILGEVFRRVTGRTDRSVPAHRDRRTARRRRPHRLVAGRTTPLRRAGEQAARPRPAGRRASPRLPDQPGRPPQGRDCRSRWDSPRTTNWAPTT